MILQKLPNAHVTLLSLKEEGRNDFIRRSGSVVLGLIREQSFKVDIRSICEVIKREKGKGGQARGQFGARVL
jgi:hypothetical protein